MSDIHVLYNLVLGIIVTECKSLKCIISLLIIVIWIVCYEISNHKFLIERESKIIIFHLHERLNILLIQFCSVQHSIPLSNRNKHLTVGIDILEAFISPCRDLLCTNPQSIYLTSCKSMCFNCCNASWDFESCSLSICKSIFSNCCHFIGLASFCICNFCRNCHIFSIQLNCCTISHLSCRIKFTYYCESYGNCAFLVTTIQISGKGVTICCHTHSRQDSQ